MAYRHSDLWQITILTDTQQSLVLLINRYKPVKELFKLFREKYPVFRKKTHLVFASAEGVELEATDKRRLVDVDFLRDTCTIQLIVHETKSDTWQLYIRTDTYKTIPIVINKNQSVADLFGKIRAKDSVYRKQRLSLVSANEPELQENDRQRLVDVGFLRDKCNLQLIVHVDGGGWPTQSEVEQQIRDPTRVPSLAGRITNELPDIMSLDDETPRVMMSCGHAIAPSSLALHCYNEIENGAHSIQCPALNCRVVWSFKCIIDAACLSSNETNEFERKMISNGLSAKASEIKKCPGCETYCRRRNENKTRIRCKKCTSTNGRKFAFCWSCLREWENGRKAVWCGNPECGDHTELFKCLASCGTKIVNGIECPSRRACPECLTLIEHKDKCKHMKCPSKSCKYEFCFICLKRYPCGTGDHKPCPLAPCQGSTYLGSPPPQDNCSIL